MGLADTNFREWINNKALLCRTGNCTRYLVINLMEKKKKFFKLEKKCFSCADIKYYKRLQLSQQPPPHTSWNVEIMNLI